MYLTNILDDLLDLFFPRICFCCGNKLMGSETFLCLICLSNIPRTTFHKTRGNRLEQMFFEKIPVERAATFAVFTKGGGVQKIIHALKYKNQPGLGIFIGKLCALSLVQDNSFTAGIDFLVPIPLHPKKEKIRGYNQALKIAEGISMVTGIPILSGNLVRMVNNKAQAMQPLYERSTNAEEIFRVVDFQEFEGRHLLIIDDVITSGSTVASCVKIILKETTNVKISVYSVCAALG